MQRELCIDLPKLGARAYLQGGTIFNGMLDACDQTLGADWLTPGIHMSFKLEREACSNGRFVVSDAPIASLIPNATFTAKNGRLPVFGYFVEEGRQPDCEPYNEEQYNRPLVIQPELSGEFVLPANRPRADFIKGLVGANKLLHQKVERFGGELQKIQFLYFKGLEGVCLLECAPELRLVITNRFVEEREAEVWTINHVAVHAPSFTSELRLCYRARKLRGGHAPG